jgi:hypothetical protein
MRSQPEVYSEDDCDKQWQVVKDKRYKKTGIYRKLKSDDIEQKVDMLKHDTKQMWKYLLHKQYS